MKNNKTLRIHKEIPLPSDILDIADAYKKAGKELYLVGGAIRDFLLGNVPKDFDLSTNALPDESIVILRDFNVSNEQGSNFGVIRVYTKDEPLGHEIASFRKDISGGRDNKSLGDKVEMGSHITIEDDCRRRDLTINAIFYDINKGIIVDIVNGVSDIRNNIIRMVGSPSERFKEDRLRILRFFRFASRLGGLIDKDASDSIKKDNRLRNICIKEDVSQERIWEEMNKAYEQAKDYDQYLSLLTEYNMWVEIFPNSSINTSNIYGSFLTKITNLFRDESIENLESNLVSSYKMDKSFSKKVIFLVSLLNFDSEKICEFYKNKKNSGITDSEIRQWINSDIINKLIIYRPTVSSSSLIEKGFTGELLGKEIKRLETEIFKNEVYRL